MITGSKQPVVANIKKEAAAGALNHKVEVRDAALTPAQASALMHDYLRLTKTAKYRVNNLLARGLAGLATQFVNAKTEISGLEKIQQIKGRAIVTSNHFSPLENTVVRKTLWQVKHRRLFIVSEDTNLLAHGLEGYLMKYYDTIPVSADRDYIGKTFPRLLNEALTGDNYVLIYPEQEMWFNYRKPRPLKRGAYYYAARFGVPIISCFVEIVDTKVPSKGEFNKLNFKMHVLDPIYVDPSQTVRANSIRMMNKDYEQKKAAYEKIYGEHLTYDFEPKDIVGWRGTAV